MRDKRIELTAWWATEARYMGNLEMKPVIPEGALIRSLDSNSTGISGFPVQVMIRIERANGAKEVYRAGLTEIDDAKLYSWGFREEDFESGSIDVGGGLSGWSKYDGLNSSTINQEK